MISLNGPPSPVYRTSVEQKKQAQEAAKRRRGTPKFLRDLLREKCRLRMQEARQNCFQQARIKHELVYPKFKIDEVLRQEVAELEKDVDLQQQIYEELREEANEWFFEQREKEESYLFDFSGTDITVCPICQKSELNHKTTQQRFECICGASFLYTSNISELNSELQSTVDGHESHCGQNLLFFTEPFQNAKKGISGKVENENVLSAFCESCEFFKTF